MISHSKVKHGFACLFVCNVFEKKYKYIHCRRFPFTKLKRFWKFRLGCKRNMIFGSFHWKISGKNWTSEKVVPFSRWKFSDGITCSIYGFRRGFFQFQAALDIFSVRKYGGYTERITSELTMNHTNAKTCLSRGIGGLPNACCWGTLPVASTSRRRSSKVPRVILNWLSNWSTVYAGKIFH